MFDKITCHFLERSLGRYCMCLKVCLIIVLLLDMKTLASWMLIAHRVRDVKIVM